MDGVLRVATNHAEEYGRCRVATNHAEKGATTHVP